MATKYAPYTYSTVGMALESMTVDELKHLASLVPTSKRPTNKGGLVALILDYLTDEGIRAIWDQLDTLQRAAVAETVHGPDYGYSARRFSAKYGKEPDWGTKESWQYRPSRLGFFFYRGSMPQDIKERLKSFVPPPEPLVLASQEGIPPAIMFEVRHYDYETKKYYLEPYEVPLTQCLVERAAQQELIAVLRLVATGKMAVSEKTRLPTAATIKAVTALLQDGDYYTTDVGGAQEVEVPQEDDNEGQEIGPIKGYAWPMILLGARLAEISGKRLVLTDAGRKALAAPPAFTLRNAWQAWLKTDVLDELRRINVIKGQTGKGARSLTAPRTRRAKIAEALMACPPGRWVLVSDFLRYLLAADLDFEVTRDEWSLYIHSSGYGALGQGNAWIVLQKRYIVCFLFEYAATLGLFDVAYIPPDDVPSDYGNNWGTDDLDFLSRYDGLLYLRMTPLGAYSLGLDRSYTPAPLVAQPILKVLPNYDIVITQEAANSGDTLLLATYAVQTSPAVWKLEPSKLLDAMEAGHSLAELREFLETRGAGELPNTVDRLLNDYGARGGRLIDKGFVKLIECSDSMLATLIANDTQAKKYCYQAGERHLVVPIEAEKAFRKAVKQLGYLLPL
jgi:hypothetical protein